MIEPYSEELVRAVSGATPAWVERAVAARLVPPWPLDLAARVDAAGESCRDDLVSRLTALLALDIDDQRSTPLVILRSAFRWPSEVLAEAGVAHVRRDPFDVRVEPDDVFDLAPRGWSDFGDDVAEAGLRWGAAKAMVHLRRHANDA